MMHEIKTVVTEISGRRNKDCYYVLCCAVAVALSYQPAEVSMKTICTEVRKQTNMRDDRSVSKALSRAVTDIVENGNMERLQEIYGRKLLERPMPKELIRILAQYVWEKTPRQEVETSGRQA